MMVFVDTSALYAVFDRDDRHHTPAVHRWNALLSSGVRLLTHNYVVLEAASLFQHRLGVAAVRDLVVEVLPVCEVHWVTEAVHAVALHRLLSYQRRRLSLTDCVSFEVMDRAECSRAFAFDAHFEEMGFDTVLPE